MVGHPSAPVVSAAFALAEDRGLDGEQLVVALVAGYEVAARVGLAVGQEHYLAGWHATGTIGTFAAAAAAGRAIGLDAAAMEQALGLAATQAAGLKVSFGTMAKPLHAGRAAAAGVLSALLAEQGLTAARGAVEGHQGFAATQAPGFDPGRPDREMSGRLGIESVLFKQHACCGGTHGSISALRRIVGNRTFVASDVRRVRVQVSRQMLDICAVADPVSGTEGKFSLRHVASLVLAGRSTGPTGFTAAAVNDEELVALRALVEVVESGHRTGHDTEVTLWLANGDALTAQSDARAAVTDDKLPLEWTILCEKFIDLVEPVLGSPATSDVIACVADVGHGSSAADLLALTGSTEVAR
jgi:2-methylcitrate dehydratase PrpD